MGNTGLGEKGMAVGYREDGLAAPTPVPLFRFSASGLHSSVEDLYLFDQALHDGRLLANDHLKLMFTGYAETPSLDFEGAEYGYGWFIGEILDRPVILHSGMAAGHSAMLMRFPNEEVTIVVLRNLEMEVYDRLEIELAKIVFND